jgi:PilZ domain
MSNNAIYDYRRCIERKPSFLACGFLLFGADSLTIGFNDISLTGAGISSPTPLPINAQIKLALNTKKKGLIIIEGKICWCKKTFKGWHSGIVFNRKMSFEPDMIA